MYCKKCGGEIREGANFCDRCGTPLGTAPQQAMFQQNQPVKNNSFSTKKILICALSVIILIMVILAALNLLSNKSNHSTADQTQQSTYTGNDLGSAEEFWERYMPLVEGKADNLDYYYIGPIWDNMYFINRAHGYVDGSYSILEVNTSPNSDRIESVSLRVSLAGRGAAVSNFDLDSVFLAANLIPDDMTEKRDEAIIDMFNASGFYDHHQTLDNLKKFTPRSVVIKGVEYSILNKYKEKNELIFTIKPAKK